MNMPIVSTSTHFSDFIWKSTANRLYIASTIILSCIIWFTFKRFYPNPNLIFDSFHYLKATVENLNAYAWPIGYPKFIRWLGVLTHSANSVAAIQYALLQLSFLFFFLSFRYLFSLGKWPSLVIYLFLQFNPIFIYSCNLILSDVLFTALSILWITQLIWIIYDFKPWMIITHALVLLLTFTVRYNALYYPIVASIAFLASKQQWEYKLSGIGLQIIVLGGFIAFTSNAMFNKYGVQQFSPFGGWKLANDALYIYEHVYKENDQPVPLKFKGLDNTVKEYFNSKHDTVDLWHWDVTSGSYYMYIYPSPLMKYMRSIYGEDYNPLNYKTFAPMGPLYQEYGSYLIRKHPKAFIKHFIYPNFYRYLTPPPEVYTDNVNPFVLRNDALDSAARKWFNLKSTSAPIKSINFRTDLFNIYSITSLWIHIIFFLLLAFYFILRLYKHLNKFNLKIISLIAILWSCDLAFSILAAAIVLRYQLFSIIIETSFIPLLVELFSKDPVKNNSK